MKTQTFGGEISGSQVSSNQRHGAVLVATLVCLLVVMAMLGAMLRGTLRAHRQLHSERDLRQTELLLQAGSERAVFRLAKGANYRGETWSLPADAIANTGEGRVAIAISPAAGQTAQKANIVAEYPFGDETSIRRSFTFHIPTQQPRE